MLAKNYRHGIVNDPFFCACALLIVSLLSWCNPAASAPHSVQTVDGSVSYPEGPVFFAGRLHYVEYSAGTIRTLESNGSAVWWHAQDCGPSGLAVYREHLLVACYDTNELVEIDRNAHEVARFRYDDSGAVFRGPNDFTSDGHGGVYFSASGEYDVKAPISGAVLHLTADGRVLRLAETVHYPNGLTLDATGTHLLVAEMLAARILSFPIEADGRLGTRRVWARLDDLVGRTAGMDAYNGPDGLKLGPNGCYYVAQNGSGRVLVVNPDAQLIDTVPVPARFVTNVGFDPAGAGFITATFDEWHAPYRGAVYRFVLGKAHCASE